ncbi:EI24 domain-containing protein [Roseovarius sp. SCSIO 43702]|uniref:EI24 domain-containing protein n=1 Tax=Roseovarius sp. SCSIO 43702 TaxID=2823043 RepID=UPI001C72AA9B|nr:EI24 domain-containing protein [Roseovarius sp. SCSIO 43702]QYX57810.1 EI24 domain-containing protein [Roseovarius sp. SCSIO 43702]
MIFSSFFKAIAQVSDPRFRRVLYLGIGLAFALLVAVYALFLVWMQWALGEGAELPLIGEVTWLDDLLSWGSLVLMLILSVFLMVPVASAITSMFLDDVAQAVEDRHHPHLPPVPRMSWTDAVTDTLAFLGVLIVVNLLAIVLYLLFAPAAIFIFWAVNGFLLGREYFQLAAMRRVGRKRAKELRRANLGTIWVAGTLMAIPLSVPLLNLVIPILGAATFTHIFHAVARDAGLSPSG